MAPEAIQAVGLMAEDRRASGCSPSPRRPAQRRLVRGQRARERGNPAASSQVERLLDGLPPRAALVTVCDAHPAALAWLGAVAGHRTRALGVEHFGQTGRIADLFRHYGIDVDGILRAADALAPGRPLRRYRSA